MPKEKSKTKTRRARKRTESRKCFVGSEEWCKVLLSSRRKAVHKKALKILGQCSRALVAVKKLKKENLITLEGETQLYVRIEALKTNSLKVLERMDDERTKGVFFWPKKVFWPRRMDDDERKFDYPLE